MNNKRNIAILALAILSVLLFAALANMQAAADNPNMDHLLGSWNVVVTVEGQGATFPALLTFGAGGNVISDEPGMPGETSGHGNWTDSDDGTVAYTFVALFAGEDGSYAGKLEVTGTLQYDDATNRWQGPFMIDVFDADDQVSFNDHGTFLLTRIEIKPME